MGFVKQVAAVLFASVALSEADFNPRSGQKSDPIRWAYNGKLGKADAERLLSDAIGLNFEVVIATDYKDAANKVAAGQADIAALDTVATITHMGKFKLIVAELLDSGLPYHKATTLVKADAGIYSFADLQGKKACFTGFGASTSMDTSIGHYIRNRMITIVDTLKETVETYFSAVCAAPELCTACKEKSGCKRTGIYSHYEGALRCLSEGGGDVAFVKQDTHDVYCGKGASSPKWCLPKDSYKVLDYTGEVPSHSVVVQIGALTPAAETTIQEALAIKLPKSTYNGTFIEGMSEGGVMGYSNTHGTLAGHEAVNLENLACLPHASQLLGINTLPNCKYVDQNLGPSTNTRSGTTQQDAIRWAYHGEGDTSRLTELLQAQTSLYFQVIPTSNRMASANMLRDSTADITSLDTITAVARLSSLNLLVAEVHSSGLDYHNCVTLVRKESKYRSIRDLKGKKACFTKFAKDTSMDVPVGYYVKHGLMKPYSTLKETVSSFFSSGVCAIPDLCGACKDSVKDGSCTKEDPYAGYEGALRCLSEGAGDVAFVKADTYKQYCGAGVSPRPAWCLAPESIDVLDITGFIPAHPIVVRPGAMSPAVLSHLKNGLIATSPQTQTGADLLPLIKKDIEGFQDVGTSLQAYEQKYMSAVECLPGVQVREGLTNLPACV
eukprot:Ihof_evm3s615 gene=Ihof_evmTU3s615